MVEGMVEGMLGVHFGAKSIVLQRKNKVLRKKEGAKALGGSLFRV